jgi:DNA-binding response OmpR family regulator
MDAEKRELISRTLRSLAEAHASMMELMEQTMTLLNEELALDAVTFWKTRHSPKATSRVVDHLDVDHEHLRVSFRGKSCFLGNTLPFRLLAHLASRPNSYLTHEELLEDVWDGLRSDSAIRSVVKRLRAVLRREGLPELADAIDGSMPGRYGLRASR